MVSRYRNYLISDKLFWKKVCGRVIDKVYALPNVDVILPFGIRKDCRSVHLDLLIMEDDAKNKINETVQRIVEMHVCQLE